MGNRKAYDAEKCASRRLVEREQLYWHKLIRWLFPLPSELLIRPKEGISHFRLTINL